MRGAIRTAASAVNGDRYARSPPDRDRPGVARGRPSSAATGARHHGEGGAAPVVGDAGEERGGDVADASGRADAVWRGGAPEPDAAAAGLIKGAADRGGPLPAGTRGER